MGMSDHQIETIETAALLHDVGKIGLHSDILTKPGPLTDEEYDLIKEHPAHTKKILNHISGFTHIVDIAYMHHERYDGKGYPDGISGDDIPIESAIISIVDAFDVMTSDRSYRKALTIEQAYRILQNEAAHQFNPLVVEAFLAWHKRHYNHYPGPLFKL